MKTIWKIRSTKQLSIGCSPFSEHFNRSPNTFWKSLVSHAINLDKGKPIMSRDRAQDWGANVTFEDGYLENAVADKRGYESDPTDKPDRSLQRDPPSNPFSQGGNWFRTPWWKTLRPLVENHCRIQRIRLHLTMEICSEKLI